MAGSRWKVRERVVEKSRRAQLSVAEVDLPDGVHFEQWVLRFEPAAIVAVLNDRDEVLMIRRHRFVIDQDVWELPGGYVVPGEDPAVTATREVENDRLPPTGLYGALSNLRSGWDRHQRGRGSCLDKVGARPRDDRKRADRWGCVDHRHLRAGRAAESGTEQLSDVIVKAPYRGVGAARSEALLEVGNVRGRMTGLQAGP